MTLWLPAGYRGRTETEVRRSRFLCTLARADSEDAARALIAEVRRELPDARHHCSAFVVEVPDAQPIERSSDDGEPAGTAGMPMLAALKGAGVSRAAAVVTRYFGGIKLGTGGLVRAYTDAVAQALDAAPRVRAVRRPLYRVRVEVAEFGRLQSDLLGEGVEVVGQSFGADAELTLEAPEAWGAADALARLLRRRVDVASAGWAVGEAPVT